MESLNQKIFEFLFGLAHQSVFWDSFFIFSAKYLPWLIVVGALIQIFKKKNWSDSRPAWKDRFQRLALGFIAVILSRGVVANIIESLISSPRPFAVLSVEPLFQYTVGNSLPSGHMAFLIPIALTMFLVSKKSGWSFLGLTLLVGFMRVVSGVHWPEDILMGIAVGALSFLAVYILFRKRELLVS